MENAEYPMPVGRILDLVPHEGDTVTFIITQDTTSCDLDVTLAFLMPKPENVQTAWRHILRVAVDNMGVLNNASVILARDIIKGTNATIDRSIKFGDTVTMQDVVSSLAVVYPEDEISSKVEELAKNLIDSHKLEGAKIIAKPQHEFTHLDDMLIAQEMAWLTIEHFNED